MSASKDNHNGEQASNAMRKSYSSEQNRRESVKKLEIEMQ